MQKTKQLILASLFLSLGLVLPFLTMQVPEIGNMLLPMHLPVMICGFICGPYYGLLVGFITPLLRSALFTMPVMVPNALCMAFELATYGMVTGFLYRLLKHSKFKIYISLLVSMIVGRIIWGIVGIIIYGFKETAFTFQMFMAGALLNAIPGIILQLILIPLLIYSLEKAGVMNIEHR